MANWKKRESTTSWRYRLLSTRELAEVSQLQLIKSDRKENHLKLLGGGFTYFGIFAFYLGKIPILTNIFQGGWNHQLETSWHLTIKFHIHLSQVQRYKDTHQPTQQQTQTKPVFLPSCSWYFPSGIPRWSGWSIRKFMILGTWRLFGPEFWENLEDV